MGGKDTKNSGLRIYDLPITDYSAKTKRIEKESSVKTKTVSKYIFTFAP